MPRSTHTTLRNPAVTLAAAVWGLVGLSELSRRTPLVVKVAGVVALLFVAVLLLAVWKWLLVAAVAVAAWAGYRRLRR